MTEDIKTEELNVQELDAQELDELELDEISGGAGTSGSISGAIRSMLRSERCRKCHKRGNLNLVGKPKPAGTGFVNATVQCLACEQVMLYRYTISTRSLCFVRYL